MSINDYIEQRLKEQIEWYSSKSRWNQQWFKRLIVVQLSCAIFLPVIAIYFSPIFTGILGGAIAFITGILSVYRFQESWVEYRATSEKLKHQLIIFETRVEPYHDDTTRFSILVKTVEGILSQENVQWQARNTLNETETSRASAVL